MNRITVQISNLRILLEYPLKNDRVSMILEICLDSLQYKNKSGIGRVTIANSSSGDEASSSLNALPAFITHNVSMKGINVCLEEQRKDQRFADDSGSMEDLKQIILQMDDEQNMEIIVKQCEEISGPKINLNIQLCELKYFLAPRQINLMLHCFKRYVGPENTSTNQFPPRGRNQEFLYNTTRGATLNTYQESYRQMESVYKIEL